MSPLHDDSPGLHITLGATFRDFGVGLSVFLVNVPSQRKRCRAARRE